MNRTRLIATQASTPDPAGMPEMDKILFAIGNPFRRDDGAAGRVVELLGPVDGVTVHQIMQLAPELACDMAAARAVVFLDAALGPGPARLERIHGGAASRAPIGHAISPEEVVALAESLFGFSGAAWICPVPGDDFADGEGLSETAEANARVASELLLRYFTEQ